jgi:hypothetical protein
VNALEGSTAVAFESELSLEGSTAVAFESELSFEGVDDGLDPLPDGAGANDP